MYNSACNLSHQSRLFRICITLIITSGVVSCNEETSQKAEVSKDTIPDIIAPVSKTGPFEQSLIDQGLVNIQDIDPSILVDLKYSTTDNFFGEDVYEDLTHAYLQLKPAQALAAVNDELKQIDPNLRLMVYDGARPLKVQKILWEKLDTIPYALRTNYVADPGAGSIHNFGCAVDLSIFDISKDSVLDMGTPYDHFGELAYPRLEDQLLEEGRLNKEQIINRRLLRKVMEKHHFLPITSEWWHFNYHSRETAKKNYKIIE